MNDLKVGDIVRLNSGGPLMTVDCIEDDRVTCVWFPDESVHKIATFSSKTIQPYTEKETNSNWR